MKITEATFLTSAQSIMDSPSPDKAEVAFLGRSNVGKSSLLNTLTNRKGLAKSSSTPGKTQLINYFDIKFKTENEELPYLFARFVDLPGFGYARVSGNVKVFENAKVFGKAIATKKVFSIDFLKYNTTLTDNHIQIGIDSLNELMNDGRSVRHLRFD